MLNLFGSSSSVSCQFLVLESPLFQVISMKNQAKNPLFEGLCYNLKRDAAQDFCNLIYDNPI